MNPIDLRPGDVIISYKKPPQWNLLKRFMDWRLKCYSKRKYGKNCKYPHMNHNRNAMGSLQDVAYVGHWTSPAATYDRVERWLLESTPGWEVHIFRPKVDHVPSAAEMFAFFSEYDGTLYDIFDLPSMEFGLTKFFYGLSKKNFVCSPGSRHWSQKMVFLRDIDPSISLSDTPPCWPAQYPELFEELI